MRVTDYDATWKEHYDSAYLGNVELDNGERYEHGPIWAINEYWRQHYLDFYFYQQQNNR